MYITLITLNTDFFLFHLSDISVQKRGSGLYLLTYVEMVSTGHGMPVGGDHPIHNRAVVSVALPRPIPCLAYAVEVLGIVRETFV